MSEDANLTQTEETASTETTTVDSPSAALSAKSSDASEANQTVDTNSEGTQDESSTGEYDWVPKVFMKDGQPDFQNLAKSYEELQTAFRTKRGAESVDDYSYELENADLFNEQMLPNLKAQALEWGMSTEQFGNVAGMLETIVKEQNDTFQSVLQQELGSAENTERVLKEAWGQDYDTNMQAVDKAWNAYRPEGVGADAFTNDPAMYQLLARIGAELSEDGVTNPKTGLNSESVPSQQEIDELMNDPLYWDQSSGIADKVAGMLARRAAASA